MVPYESRVVDIPSNQIVPYLPPDDDYLKNLTERQLLEIYWRYINTLQVLCRNQTRLGALGDGGKEMCEDEKYKPRKPCLVYSFGSNFQFDFEDDVIKRYRCEVHTFDPSKPLMKGTAMPTGINFHLAGLSDREMTDRNGWQMQTLTSIRKQLNHSNRTVDILKIDIEGSEWTALPEMLQSGVLKYVKQICIEVHVGKIDSKYSRNWGNAKIEQTLSILRKLYENGFSIFMREHNMYSATPGMTTVNEISLINVNI